MRAKKKNGTKDKKTKVIIGVKDGVAFGIKVPKGMVVEIHDYDVEGTEPGRFFQDTNGDDYVKGIL